MGQAGSRDENAFQQASAGSLAGQAEAGPSTAGAQSSAEDSREDSVVPTVLQWSQGGAAVFVTGSFNAWGERIPMRRSGNECVVCLNLLPGTYQYKFIVDNEWKFAADQPTVRDEMGNINNCITVEDQSLFMREEPMSGFFSENAPNLYTQALPDEITLAKEPPQAPVHLWCLPLNQRSTAEPQIAALTQPPPLSVTLTHMAVLRSSPTTTLAMTQRFRHKYVTVIIYKPPAQPKAQDPQAVDTEDPFRVPSQPARDVWPRPRAPVPGGKRPSQVNWTDANNADGASPHDCGQSASVPTAMPPPMLLPHPPSGAQPMDLGGSRPASQAAFMEVG